MPHTLIMAPTRELCIQIFSEALKLCFCTNLRCSRTYDEEQGKAHFEDLARGADLVVGTPRRLWDWIDTGVISVKRTHVLVLDEVVRMLELGMESQIRQVVEKYGMPCKDARQTMMFSDSFPEPYQHWAQDFMLDYIWVGTHKRNDVTFNVELMTQEEKVDRLIDYVNCLRFADPHQPILKQPPLRRALVIGSYRSVLPA